MDVKDTFQSTIVAIFCYICVDVIFKHFSHIIINLWLILPNDVNYHNLLNNNHQHQHLNVCKLLL